MMGTRMVLSFPSSKRCFCQPHLPPFYVGVFFFLSKPPPLFIDHKRTVPPFTKATNPTTRHAGSVFFSFSCAVVGMAGHAGFDPPSLPHAPNPLSPTTTFDTFHESDESARLAQNERPAPLLPTRADPPFFFLFAHVFFFTFLLATTRPPPPPFTVLEQHRGGRR